MCHNSRRNSNNTATAYYSALLRLEDLLMQSPFEHEWGKARKCLLSTEVMSHAPDSIELFMCLNQDCLAGTFKRTVGS